MREEREREIDELMENWASVVASVAFFVFLAMHLLSRYLDRHKKKGSKSDDLLQLRQEIKLLLQEANSLSGPSTFAQSAKLRRVAAAKEKELERISKVNTKEANGSYNVYFTALRVLKVLMYVGLSWWFWGVPVAIIAQQQIFPFGKVLSWGAGNNIAGHVTACLPYVLYWLRPIQDPYPLLQPSMLVGAVPWLTMTSSVSKLISQKLLP